MGRPYADLECGTCEGVGSLETVTPSGASAGTVPCHTCHGIGDV